MTAAGGLGSTTPSLTGGERPQLRVGANGDSVVELQSMLNHVDEVTQHLAVDGDFGALTDKAVRQFQSAHAPMPVDGIVGPLTWAALDSTPSEVQTPTAVAKKLFQRGSDAYERGEFAHAYDLMTAADEQYHHSSITFSRGQCLRRLGGRRQDAIALFELHIAEGGPRAADAQTHIDDLRGPAKSGDETVDVGAAKAAYVKGEAAFNAKQFNHAYDEFTIADNLAHRAALTFDRAQALRLVGGRSPEAIVLYDQYVTEGGPRTDEAKQFLTELRGPEKSGVESLDTGAAKAHFDEGAKLFTAGDYGHAYDKLTIADRLAHRPAITFSRAQCLRHLGGRRAETIALFEQSVVEGGPRAEESRFYIRELKTQGALNQTKKI